MNATTIDRTAALLTHGPDKAITLALTLAQAERAIHAFTAGQVDAIVDADGQPYLLRALRFVEATAAQVSDGALAQVILILRPLVEARPIFDERPRLRVPPVPAVAPAKDRFLSMLSHELRTPLTPILLGVAEMERDERFADAAPALAMIRRNVDLQARLLDELMEFTLVGEHKVRLRLEPLDLHAHIGYVVETCQSELTAAQITVLLDFDPGSGGVMVCADSLRLQQVMWNLVKNAIKFSPPGSSIIIATSDCPPGHLAIDFTDQGVGIEPELLERVFDAFQQGSAAQQRNKGGLGLFIAKGLAEAQDGRLTVHSEGSGLGSTFRLILPKPPADGTCLPIESSSLFSAAALRPAGA